MKTEKLWKLRAGFLRELGEIGIKEKAHNYTQHMAATVLDLFIRWIEESSEKSGNR